ncbi:MAG TPA: hypothetical protein VMF89_09285, partial [Polyangiales bacterium]|nr:hypothetical protein [Polyangiales bacterium]
MVRFTARISALLSSVALALGSAPVRALDAAPASEEQREESEAPAQVLQLPASAEETEDGELLEAVPGDPWGDAHEPNFLSLRSLFQARYASTFAERSVNMLPGYAEREESLAQEGDGYSINRLFLRVSSDPVKYVGFKAILDFAELIDGDPEDVIKQAYSIVRPIPGRLELVVGLFKIPFATAEMDPSARYEFASFGPAGQLLGTLG